MALKPCRKLIRTVTFCGVWLAIVLLGAGHHAKADPQGLRSLCRVALTASLDPRLHSPYWDEAFSARLEAMKFTHPETGEVFSVDVVNMREYVSAINAAIRSRESVLSERGRTIQVLDEPHLWNFIWRTLHEKVDLTWVQKPKPSENTEDTLHSKLAGQVFFVLYDAKKKVQGEGALIFDQQDRSVYLAGLYLRNLTRMGIGPTILSTLQQTVPVGTKLQFEDQNFVSKKTLQKLVNDFNGSEELQRLRRREGEEAANAYVRTEFLRRAEAALANGAELVWLKVLKKTGWRVTSLEIKGVASVIVNAEKVDEKVH